MTDKLDTRRVSPNERQSITVVELMSENVTLVIRAKVVINATAGKVIAQISKGFSKSNDRRRHPAQCCHTVS